MARPLYPSHRDQAEVARYEALGCYCDLPHVHGHKTDCPVWKQMMGCRLVRDYTKPRPGRYALSGDKAFTALCGHPECTTTVTASWGESGSARAAELLRRAGWQMRGATNRALWFCPHHVQPAGRGG